MRKLYIDNIRWITVVLVVLYHVIKKRTGKLLVPSTLGLLVFWWILGYYNLLISGGLEEMAKSSKTGFIYHHGSQRHRTAMVYPDVMDFFSTAHMGSQSGKKTDYGSWERKRTFHFLCYLQL